MGPPLMPTDDADDVKIFMPLGDATLVQVVPQAPPGLLLNNQAHLDVLEDGRSKCHSRWQKDLRVAL
jgi:hypothetical protein